MFCTKCGKEIAETSKFCDYCGAEQVVAGVGTPLTKSVIGSSQLLDKKCRGISTAGRVMAFLGPIVSIFLRLTFQVTAYPYMYLPKGYKGLVVISAIMFALSSIFISANDKVKNKDLKIVPSIIESIICLGISLLVILIKINIKSGNY